MCPPKCLICHLIGFTMKLIENFMYTYVKNHWMCWRLKVKVIFSVFLAIYLFKLWLKLIASKGSEEKNETDKRFGYKKIIGPQPLPPWSACVTYAINEN